MSPPPSQNEFRDRLVFYPIVVVGGLFCVTAFASVVAMFGDPAHPLQGLLNRYGTPVLLVEAGLLVVVALGAMTIDRVLTLRQPKMNTDGSSVPGENSRPEREPADVG